MENFASGFKRNYYGKSDVSVYRLRRDGHVPPGESALFGANVSMLAYGDAFWPTYTTGDNTNLVATDSMKNFIQRETMNFTGGAALEAYAYFLAEKFLNRYGQAEGLQVSAEEIPYVRLEHSDVSFAPSGPERAIARVELKRTDGKLHIAELASGFRGFRLLRLGGSSFQGFVRDEYTTLPDIANRPLHMWLSLDWTYVDAAAALADGSVAARVRGLVHETFRKFESGSIQQVIYLIGTRMLETVPAIAEVHLEAQNRTWDTIAESGTELGVYTDPRPPYGCLGLRLKR